MEIEKETFYSRDQTYLHDNIFPKRTVLTFTFNLFRDNASHASLSSNEI